MTNSSIKSGARKISGNRLHAKVIYLTYLIYDCMDNRVLKKLIDSSLTSYYPFINISDRNQQNETDVISV